MRASWITPLKKHVRALRAEGFGGVWELGGEGEPLFVERRF